MRARQPPVARLASALLLGGALASCGADPHPGEAGASEARASSRASVEAEPLPARAGEAASTLATTTREPAPTATTSAGASESPSEPGACTAPSLAGRGDLDARDDAAFERCAELRAPRSAHACGEGDVPRLALAPLDAAVLPLDAATAEHVRAIATRGRALGRNARAFGLVGDSMTVSGAFLRPFRAPRLAPAVSDALRIPGRSETAIDHYRASQGSAPGSLDSFLAPRAAKVGARAAWALAGEPHSALDTLVAAQSPAVVIVLFGGNDAAYRLGATHALARDFGRDLERIVDWLESRGIVPVLNTIARHGHAPGTDDCGPADARTNWRIAVQTSALSAEVAAVACRRALPLVDLRAALDATSGHGLGGDGVHLSSYAPAIDALDERGLACGNNVRSYVTLAMLAHLVPLLAP